MHMTVNLARLNFTICITLLVCPPRQILQVLEKLPQLRPIFCATSTQATTSSHLTCWTNFLPWRALLMFFWLSISKHVCTVQIMRNHIVLRIPQGLLPHTTEGALHSTTSVFIITGVLSTKFLVPNNDNSFHSWPCWKPSPRSEHALVYATGCPLATPRFLYWNLSTHDRALSATDERLRTGGNWHQSKNMLSRPLICARVHTRNNCALLLSQNPPPYVHVGGPRSKRDTALPPYLKYLIHSSSLHIVRHSQTFLINLSQHLKRQMKMNLAFPQLRKENLTAQCSKLWADDLSAPLVLGHQRRKQIICERHQDGKFLSMHGFLNDLLLSTSKHVCTIEIMRNHDLLPTFRLDDESLSFANFWDFLADVIKTVWFFPLPLLGSCRRRSLPHSLGCHSLRVFHCFLVKKAPSTFLFSHDHNDQIPFEKETHGTTYFFTELGSTRNHSLLHLRFRHTHWTMWTWLTSYWIPPANCLFLRKHWWKRNPVRSPNTDSAKINIPHHWGAFSTEFFVPDSDKPTSWCSSTSVGNVVCTSRPHEAFPCEIIAWAADRVSQHQLSPLSPKLLFTGARFEKLTEMHFVSTAMWPDNFEIRCASRDV